MPKMKPLRAVFVALILLAVNIAVGACGDAATATTGTAGGVLPAGSATTIPAATVSDATATSGTNAGTTAPADSTTAPAVDGTTAPAGTTAPTDTTAPATTAPVATIAPITTAPPATDIPNVSKFVPVFAAYTEKSSSVKPSVKAYSVSANLANIANLKDFQADLSPKAKDLLVKNFFAVQPSDYKQMYQAYEGIRYTQVPVFISTDSVLHVYHLLFDKALRDTEKNFLFKNLTLLNTALYTQSLTQYNAVKGTALEAAATRNLTYFAIARKLNGDTTFAPPAFIATKVSAELAQINAGQGKAQSAFWGNGYEEDYSQYVPRGHYTKSDDFKNYFKAMMWYGRLTFRLKYDDETQSALLLTQAIAVAKTPDGKKASDLWDTIYQPTAFFVGAADDLTYVDYLNVGKAIYGDFNNPAAFADSAKLSAFKKATDKLPPPKINSMITVVNPNDPSAAARDADTKGLRVMGQRFTLDAAVLQQLVYRQVGTDAKPRNLPKALDVFAAFGSNEATNLLNAMGENTYANYSTQLTKVKGQVASVDQKTWTQTLYSGWLYCLTPLGTQTYGAGYPSFMQNTAWTRKELNTGLASYTELKHDTILLAKQVYAERGGGPIELPTGYVEPNPAFYARISALATMTLTGLKQRSIITEQLAGSFDRLAKTADKLRSLSITELSGQPISDDDKTFIAFWGGTLESFTFDAIDRDDPAATPIIENQDAAVVADIATGVDKVLEEGTGRFNNIYVAIALPNGTVQIAQGAVSSYYEFTVPPSGRLTDEAWRAQLAAGKAPAVPDWTQAFTAPKP